MAQSLGFQLPNGCRIVHGAGSLVKRAYPPETNLPGTLQIFSHGNGGDKSCVPFCGPSGLFQFDTTCRMPRHVHMAPDKDQPGMRYVVEKIIVLNGVAVAELAGEIYVVPPKTMVTIGPGVPHSWVAAPPGIDLQMLGIADTPVISDGEFLAVFEYEVPTAFFPTAQTNTLRSGEEYVKCEDLEGIRIAPMDAEALKEKAWFVWGKSCRKL